MIKQKFDFIIFVKLLCSYLLFHTFEMKNPEISEEMRHGIYFLGEKTFLFALLRDYLDQSNNALYKISILRYNDIFVVLPVAKYS